MKYLPLIARVFIALIFFYAGIKNLLGFASMVGVLSEKGIFLPELMLFASIVFQVLGAVLLVVGYKARWGGILLIVFLIPTTLIFHNFWVNPEETIAFFKNLALIGALLQVYYYGAGPVSLERKSL
ncbi:MAG: DoxX family protein [Kamptonema sp. SIO1D9]|nr:DoxX family protein [Kamptonema sp. SIO1D9]